MSRYSYIAAALLLGLAGFLAWHYRTPLLKLLPASHPAGGQAAVFSAGDQANQAWQPEAGENFTFQYPAQFHATEIPLDGGGRKILVESPEPQRGFELTIQPFDEPGPLTAERIRQDLPDMAMDNVANAAVAGVPALAFDSSDENIGPTREVWFAYGGNLYQALTYPSFGPDMEAMLETFNFK